MKASRFFNVFAPAIYILEREKLGGDYALIGGYGCKYWYQYYSDKYIKHLKSPDIDIRGEKDPVAITLKKFWPAELEKEKTHKDNPQSVTYRLIQRINGAEAEIIKLVPRLDIDFNGIHQGIAYRIPCKYDKNLIVSVLDPCSLFVSKLPAFLSGREKKNSKKHDSEHLEMLAAVIPFFLQDAAVLEQAQKPWRDPKIAVQRLLSVLEPPNGVPPELPAGIDRESLVGSLKAFVTPATPTHYTEPSF
jgi:hypothetical protein